MSELKINYAKHNNSLVHIDSVPNGLKCNCYCINCHSPLIAKNNGKIKEHHFAHYNTFECKHAYETMIHELAKELFLEDMNFLKIPKFEKYFSQVFRNIDITKIYTKFVEVKDEVNIGNVIPDIVLKDEINKLLLIEIRVTHQVDDNKKRKIQSNNLSCLEIDLSNLDRKITKAELKDYINNWCRKEWINFYLSPDEEKKLLENFIANDTYESIPYKAIEEFPELFCGLKNHDCKTCQYFLKQSLDDNILCSFKVCNTKNYKDVIVTRDNNYFATEIEYCEKDKKTIKKFKTYSECLNLFPLSNKYFNEIDDKCYCNNLYYYNKDKFSESEYCGSIENLWKRKNRSSILVINNNSQVYEIRKQSYNQRRKKKYIQAFGLHKNNNKLEKITNFNKKIWRELIIKDE